MNFLRTFAIPCCTLLLSFAFNANASQRLIARKPLSVKYDSLSAAQLTALSAKGLVLLEDYGPFVVVEAPDDADVGAAAAAANLWITKDVLARRLRLAGFDIDTASTALPPGVDQDLQLADYEGAVGLYAIQFHGPIRPEWLKLLEANGVRRLQYVESNAYLVAAARGLEALRAALLDGPIQYIGVLQPAFKLSQPVRGASVSDVSPTRFTALLDGGQDLKATMAQLAGLDSGLTSGQYGLTGRRVTFVATARQVRALAKLSTVIWIEAAPTTVLSDERVAEMAAGTVGGENPTNTTGGYKQWLTAHYLDNDQPVIQVVDTGVQLSSTAPYCTPGYPWLSGGHIDLNNDGLKSRLAAGCPTCGTSLIADGFGHGSLVASIIAGDPTQSGGGQTQLGTAAKDSKGFYWGMGVFPSARILSTKFINDYGGLCGTPQFSSWSHDARTYGALFQNNSWNHDPTTYSSYSSEFDQIVRYGGTAGNDNPMSVVFSAGNGGVGPGGVRAPATAKNIISVGASGLTRDNLPGNCNSGTSFRDVAATSRRGFDPNGAMIKPDLMAPGLVAGARSGAITWSDCTGSTAALPGTDPYYFAASGTSFAAPQVTGIAALLSAAYTGNPPSFGHNWPNGFWGTPSPALLKATLIGSADSMQGGVDRATSATLGWEPATSQGWGRLSLDRFFDAAYKFVADENRSDDFMFWYTGQVKTWTLTVDDPSKEVILVLAWSDPAGPADATNPIVNQIAMYAWQSQNMYCDGYYGSHYITPTNACYIAPDTHNNVKVLRIAPGMSGNFTLELYGWNIADKAWWQDANHYQNQDWAFFGYNVRVP